jgi:hypothetical protein
LSRARISDRGGQEARAPVTAYEHEHTAGATAEMALTLVPAHREPPQPTAAAARGGLLRQIGAIACQVRPMARWEAILILAIGLGLGLAIAATALLPLSHALGDKPSPTTAGVHATSLRGPMWTFASPGYSHTS